MGRALAIVSPHHQPRQAGGMNFKAIGLLVCIGYGIWYLAIGGKQLNEQQVADLYRDYVSAFDRADGKAVCELFSDQVQGRFKSTSRTMPVKEVVDKASVCTAVDEFYRDKKTMEDAVGHELYTNIEYTIHKITVSPDRRTATAEVLLEMRIGTESGPLLDMRSTQTDVIQRSLGKAHFVRTDGTVSFYR